MVARLTRILLLLQLLVAAGIAAALLSAGRIGNPALAFLAGVAAVLLLRLLINANNFRLAWRYQSETPAHRRLNIRQACRLFFGEFTASMIASSVTMPFCAFSKRDAIAAAKPPALPVLPVLLVHGYGCNSGYWHSMSKALLRAGISHRALNMEPVIGSIDDYVPAVHEAVDALCRETGSEGVVIVAHSMGGLAARAYLRRHGARRIVKVISLGTPHAGTGVAGFGLGENCRQMEWSAAAGAGRCSDWLRGLAATETLQTYARFVSIYSHHDNIVSPQTSSRLPGADNIEFHGIGHVELAVHPAVQATVIEQIRKASEEVPLATPA